MHINYYTPLWRIIYLKLRISKKEPYIPARILGMVLIIIGAAFFINPVSLNIKIGFTSILIGLFMIFMITEKSLPKRMSDVLLDGNMEIIRNILTDLELRGNAIFLPKSKSGSNTSERIFIPPNETGVIRIPNNVYDTIFLTDYNGENLGLSIPPNGLKLLEEIEKNGKFENNELKNIEEKLQLFVGMNLVKSVSFRPHNKGWILEIEKSELSNNGCNLQDQYPCPICSAMITAITRELNQRIRIYGTAHNGNKITYYLNIIKRRNGIR